MYKPIFFILISILFRDANPRFGKCTKDFSILPATSGQSAEKVRGKNPVSDSGETNVGAPVPSGIYRKTNAGASVPRGISGKTKMDSPTSVW
jgi:hypothetical protein